MINMTQRLQKAQLEVESCKREIEIQAMRDAVLDHARFAYVSACHNVLSTNSYKWITRANRCGRTGLTVYLESGSPRHVIAYVTSHDWYDCTVIILHRNGSGFDFLHRQTPTQAREAIASALRQDYADELDTLAVPS